MESTLTPAQHLMLEIAKEHATYEREVAGEVHVFCALCNADIGAGDKHTDTCTVHEMRRELGTIWVQHLRGLKDLRGNS